jgi:hypothetical protein
MLDNCLVSKAPASTGPVSDIVMSAGLCFLNCGFYLIIYTGVFSLILFSDSKLAEW